MFYIIWIKFIHTCIHTYTHACVFCACVCVCTHVCKVKTHIIYVCEFVHLLGIKCWLSHYLWDHVVWKIYVFFFIEIYFGKSTYLRKITFAIGFLIMKYEIKGIENFLKMVFTRVWVAILNQNQSEIYTSLKGLSWDVFSYV